MSWALQQVVWDASPVLILLAVMVAQLGFWDTLGAVLSAAAVIVLFATAGYILSRPVRRRLR